MKSFTINIDIFDSVIHVVESATDEEFYKYCDIHFKDIKIERTHSTAACWTIYDEIGKSIYMFDFRFKLKKDAESINTIVHESSHGAFEIFKRVKINYIYDATDEVYCYLIAYISEKVFQGIFNKE